jgi:hypothetical protein
MNINKEIDKILKKPMSRKQFLQHIGMVLLGVLGVNAMISRLIQPEKHMPGAPEEGRRWGNGKFGV